MINKITLTNFKGIKDEVEIPIAPLTLLFGGNSSGKSTILHAVAYAREILEGGNCDVETTRLGGNAFDLGGFEEIIHGRDESKTITIRFDLDLNGVNLTEYSAFDNSFVSHSDDAFFQKPDSEINTAWVQLDIGLDRSKDGKPIIRNYEIGFNEKVFAIIGVANTRGIEIPASFPLWTRDKDKKPYLGELVRLNFRHPILTGLSNVDPNRGDNTDDVFAKPFNDSKPRKPSLFSSAEEVEFLTADGESELRFLTSGFLDEFMDDILSPLERFYMKGDFIPFLASEEQFEEMQAAEWTHVMRSVGDFEVESLRGFDRRCKCIVQGNLEQMEYIHWIGILKDSNKIAEQAISFPEFSTEEEFKRYGDIVVRLAAFDEKRSNRLFFPYQSDALPAWNFPFSYSWQTEPEQDSDTNEHDLAYDMENRKQMLQQALSLLIYGPGFYLRDCLSGSRYVGPIREILPRDYRRPRNPGPKRWANGLGAWDMLHDPDEKTKDENKSDLCKEVSGWLSRKDDENEGGLDTHYRLESETYRESYSADAEGTQKRRVLIKTEKGTLVHPQGVGVGISQVIPIIAATLADDASLCLFEQPELHLHPSQQASVGDLLIHGVTGRGKLIIAETHSIHMVLRVLRRIRQTMEGNTNKTFDRSKLAIFFVQQNDEGVDIRRIPISEEGELLRRWPDKFFGQEYEERFK